MKIIQITRYCKSVLDALNGLLPQLSPFARPLSANDLAQIARCDSSRLLMAEKRGRYIGSLTLVIFKSPTGVHARIEDLVVDSKVRGHGAGRRLIEHALHLAREQGAATVSLTSNSSREAANALYKKAGFQILRTNVYRYKTTAKHRTGMTGAI